MQPTLQRLVVGTSQHVLAQLDHILARGAASAAARKFDPTVLVSARLAPDMFPLSRQVQIACDTAKNGAYRLAGQEPPRIEDSEKTLEELRARIARTLELLAALPAEAIDGAGEREISIPLRDRTLSMSGLKYAQQWFLPNFYFHVTAAYLILRHNGVELGKADFLGGV